MSRLSEKQRADLVALCGTANLVDVRTVLMHAQLVAGPPEPGSELRLVLDVGLKHQHREDGFVVIGNFSAHAQLAPGGGDDLVRFSFGVVARYVLEGAAEPSEEQLKLFGEYNSMIHLWPYFRTFVQQSCAQLGLPPLVLPPFRAGQSLPRASGRGEGTR